VNDQDTSEHGRVGEVLVRRGQLALLCWVVAALLAVVAFDMAPQQGTTIGSAFLLLTTTLAGWTLLRAVDGVLPKWQRTSFDQAFAPKQMVITQLEEVEEVSRAVIFSRHSAMDVQSRLVPLVRRIVDALLMAKYGWGLAAPEEWVRDRVDPVVWDMLRAGTEPVDRNAPGMQLHELARLVAALEDLAGQ